ncbi:MAG: PDZ domain-containing protein [Nannocystaceae bacterium]
MPWRRAPLALLTLALAVGAPTPVEAAPAPAATKPAKLADFAYRVSMQRPERHEFQVEIAVSDVDQKTVDLQIPRWNPGHYNRTDAQRNIRAVVAKGKGGKALPVEKIDAITWRVHSGGEAFRLSYRVFRGRYDGITGAYLDDAFGFFNGAHILMYVVGQKDRACELKVDPLPGASVITGLPRGKSSGTYHADDYDDLIDAPVHVGKVDLLRFDVKKVPFRVALEGIGAYDKKKLTADITKIAEAAFGVFGGPPDAVPFKDYTFIVHLLPGGHGGLEHGNSTALGVDPFAFGDPKSYQKVLGLVAHEFFHLWNVKRIRPAVLGPFAYDREVHTGMLWFSEGVTSYYSWLLLARAGLTTEEETLEKLASVIKRVQEQPGRKLITVEQASWETWTKPDDLQNGYIDYYAKGMLIGLVLDLELRRLTAGQSSLDTVFRELWARFRESGRGVAPSELEQIVLRQGGLMGGAGTETMKKLYAEYVHGLVELDYNAHLAAAGYALTTTVDEPGGDLGWTIDARDGGVVVTQIVEGSAADKGGLSIGDRVIALDGLSVDLGLARRQVLAMAPKTTHTVTVIRNHRVLERKVTPDKGGETKYKIAAVPSPSLESLALRSAWLGISGLTLNPRGGLSAAEQAAGAAAAFKALNEGSAPSPRNQ